MKNIAIVISSMGGGGTQQYIASLIDFLASRKVKIFIYQTDYIDNTVMIKKAKLIYLKNNKKGFLRNLLLIYSIRNQLKKDRIDYIISFLPKVNCITAIANYGLKTQLTVCERNDPKRQKLPLAWSILRILSYNLAENITANSKYALQILKSWFPLKNKFYYLKNFIRCDITNSSKDNQALINNKKFNVIAVGRLTYQKNFEELINAFSFLKDTKASLIIIGSGPLKNKLNKLVFDLDLRSKVTILDYQKNISEWFKSSDLHVMTSNYEGSPNVLWEASYLSIPSVVSSNIKSALEILKDKHDVITYEAGKNKDLADKIKLMMINKNLRKKIAYNSKKSLDLFSSESVFHVWLKILNFY